MNKHDTVLIVEDDIGLRELLKTMLEGNDLNVLTASDGIEAVEVYTTNKDIIGLVLSDIGLPRLGGWDAFLRMRKINPKLKGILASGYFHPNVKEEIIQSGARDFIQKPYDAPELVETIRRMLEEEE